MLGLDFRIGMRDWFSSWDLFLVKFQPVMRVFLLWRVPAFLSLMHRGRGLRLQMYWLDGGNSVDMAHGQVFRLPLRYGSFTAHEVAQACHGLGMKLVDARF